MIDYDPHDWLNHLFDIRGSMVRQIFYRVLLCVLWSAAITYTYKIYAVPLAVSPQAHALIGLGLSLLLVFRTNSSYDRFWEGRKMWGGIVNETRNLARAAKAVMPEAPGRVRSIILWTMAFPHATMYHLRASLGPKLELGPAELSLPAEEVATVLKANHVPVAVAQKISNHLAEARREGLISDYVQMTIDQNVQLLVDYLGACERIHRTPMPFAYMVHVRRAILLYCFTLPFALLDLFGWWTIAVTLLITYLLFGIEEIGVEIEDPFGTDDNDLPLERFCGTIDDNLKAMLPE